MTDNDTPEPKQHPFTRCKLASFASLDGVSLHPFKVIIVNQDGKMISAPCFLGDDLLEVQERAQTYIDDAIAKFNAKRERFKR